MAEQKIKTSIYLPETLHWRLKEEALKRRLSDTNAMQEAIEQWIGAGQNKTFPRPTGKGKSNVIDYTKYDPVFTLLGKLLRSDIAPHVRAFLQYADEHITNNPNCMSSQDREEQINRILHEAKGAASPKVLADSTPNDGDQSPLQRGDKGPDTKDRSRAG